MRAPSNARLYCIFLGFLEQLDYGPFLPNHANNRIGVYPTAVYSKQENLLLLGHVRFAVDTHCLSRMKDSDDGRSRLSFSRPAVDVHQWLVVHGNCWFGCCLPGAPDWKIIR